MEFNDYQTRAQDTDQNRNSGRGIEIALLGLAGETGSLLAEYKKKLRDGDAYRGFDEQVGEELGDILWYVATLASGYGLELDDLAERNLTKTRRRFLLPKTPTPLPDEEDPPGQRLPRSFDYSFEYAMRDGAKKIVMRSAVGQIGDAVTDNAYADDGYRFHDVMHLSLAAHLGWSPVHRKLLMKAEPPQVERRNKVKDEVEDGGRAQVIEEAIVALAYEYAERSAQHTVNRVDWELLRSVRRLTKNQEVRSVTEAEWERAILRGFEVWKELKANDGGRVVGDLNARTLTFIPPVR
ncbi:MAG: MazG nucleotide pyrophosphohydrolase domain-containing protein [Polyangiaceae bacterium]